MTDEEKIYFNLDGLIRQAVSNPQTKGLLIYGASALGKTYRIKKNLALVGKLPQKDYFFYSGHTTPLQFYVKCCQNPDKIHIFDDESILESRTILNFVKSMLNGGDGVVEYDTSRTLPEGVQNKFAFKGKIILILNELPSRNAHLKAVESRILVYKHQLTREDIINLLYERANSEEIGGTTKEDRYFIVDWLKDKTNAATQNLNYRLYEKAVQFFVQDKDTWQDLTLTQIEKADEYTELLLLGCSCEEWTEKTGYSKRTYERRRMELGLTRAYSPRNSPNGEYFAKAEKEITDDKTAISPFRHILHNHNILTKKEVQK